MSRWSLAAAALVWIASGPAPARAAAPATLESLQGLEWAEALSPGLAVTVPAAPSSAPQVVALPDFGKVSAVLYRSGQPTQQGVDELSARGVKTILKLNDDEPAEADWAAAAGIALSPLLMSNDGPPSFEQVDAALAVIDDPARQPVLVHCHLGHDRTGLVVAAYEVVVAGMSVDQAAAEARSYGYSSPKFPDLKTWLPTYVAHRAAMPQAVP